MTTTKKKPLAQSLTVQGAAIAAASAILSPAVLAMIPPKYAWAGTILGALASVIGLRRAIS